MAVSQVISVCLCLVPAKPRQRLREAAGAESVFEHAVLVEGVEVQPGVPPVRGDVVGDPAPGLTGVLAAADLQVGELFDSAAGRPAHGAGGAPDGDRAG